jgi:hypothetical protein
MNKGIIYLIQPAELIGTNRYKIGMSNNPDLERCKNGYKKGTRYLCIMECNNPLKIENEIKKIFNTKFKLIAGNEYFEGIENDILNVFLEIVNKSKSEFNNDANNNTNNDNNNDNNNNNNNNILVIFINVNDQIIEKKFNLNNVISKQNEKEIADEIFHKICNEEKINDNWYIKFVFFINKLLFRYSGKKNKFKNSYIYETIKISDSDIECKKIVNYLKSSKKV